MNAFVTLDFIRRFPHRFWITDWSSDEHYPAGYRYKILSSREEPDGPMEFVVLLEERSGQKTEMKRLSISPLSFDHTADVFVSGLADSYDLKFELVDCTAARSEDQFERIVTAAGWHSYQPSSTAVPNSNCDL